MVADACDRTLLDRSQEAGVRTIGIGKIGDLFAHRGLDEEIHTKSNDEGIDRTIEAMRSTEAPAFIFINLVEFDQNFGHRNDCEGFRAALEAFDRRLPEIEAAQRPGDLMLITGPTRRRRAPTTRANTSPCSFGERGSSETSTSELASRSPTSARRSPNTWVANGSAPGDHSSPSLRPWPTPSPSDR